MEKVTFEPRPEEAKQEAMRTDERKSVIGRGKSQCVGMRWKWA